MPHQRAILTMDDTIGCWRTVCPYHKDWITDFKSQVAPAARSWDKPNKAWVVDPVFIDEVKGLCDKYFGNRDKFGKPIPNSGWTIHEPKQPQVLVNGNSSHYKVFVSLIPADMLKRMYFSASNIHHPDKGGDANKSRDLNVAWAQIKKELGI